MLFRVCCAETKVQEPKASLGADAEKIWPWNIGKTRITGIYGIHVIYGIYIYICDIYIYDIYIHRISGLEKGKDIYEGGEENEICVII